MREPHRVPAPQRINLTKSEIGVLSCQCLDRRIRRAASGGPLNSNVRPLIMSARTQSSMKTKPRLFVSVPDDRHLDDRRQILKRTIVQFIASHGFEPVGFEPEQFGTGLPINLDSWTVERANRLIRSSDGVLVLALARSYAHLLLSTDSQTIGQFRSPPQPLPTPYNHLEGALAISQGLPVLILYEEAMDRNGIFASGIKSTTIPHNADESWINSTQFSNHFVAWTQLVQRRRDIFLGYCSKADSVAIEIRQFLEENAFSVIDWARDFKPAGATILEEIENASTQCRCAIFLFTKDDEIGDSSTGKASFDAIPRDNVLLEAGYFTRSHGKSRVAIIREKGAKMPADLGGIIYLSFEDRKDLNATKEGILKFLESALRQLSIPSMTPAATQTAVGRENRR